MFHLLFNQWISNPFALFNLFKSDMFNLFKSDKFSKYNKLTRFSWFNQYSKIKQINLFNQIKRVNIESWVFLSIMGKPMYKSILKRIYFKIMVSWINYCIFKIQPIIYSQLIQVKRTFNISKFNNKVRVDTLKKNRMKSKYHCNQR
jgi:hypothetical protein